MISNKTIRVIAFFITLVSLLVLIVLGHSEQKSMYYDISLAIFGSSALSCLTAQISYSSDMRKIKRTIISNVLEIQTEVKKILAEYDKVLDNWDEKDFYEVNMLIRKLIGEFFSYSNTIKLEMGKDISEVIKTENIVELYKLYLNLNGYIYLVGTFLKNENKESAFQTYRECIELDKEIVEKLSVLLKKEYGKNFADINIIGLL